MPPRPFYLPEVRPELSQGDICLAPTTMIWSSTIVEAPPVIPAAPDELGQPIFVPGWQRTLSTPELVPGIALELVFSPVLVLSHDCEIDKEWNEWIEMRIADGWSEADAEAEASARTDLDTRILVSPVLGYASDILPERSWDAVRAAQKIGYFPLPVMAAFGGAEFLVHLSRACVIDRNLLHRPVRVLSLSEEARQILRFKLAEVLASRNLSVLGRLEAAVGRRIGDVKVLKRKRSDVTVALVLDDGSEVQVGVKSDAPPDAPASRLPQRP